MEKKIYKRVPFSKELAKQIIDGNVKGRVIKKIEGNDEIWYVDVELSRDKHSDVLKPFDKVLVRHLDSDVWIPAIYEGTLAESYWCTDGYEYDQCIPYEGNEHLVGTTDNPKNIK